MAKRNEGSRHADEDASEGRRVQPRCDRVDDLEAARGFHRGLLGFEELARPDLGIPGMWLGVGDLQLHFIEIAERPTPGPGFPHFALDVPTDQFKPTIDVLEMPARTSSANRRRGSTSAPRSCRPS